MDERYDDLLDEALLRRSLRLEADERAPRFDPAAIAELARPRLTPPFVLATALVALSVAITTTVMWTAVAMSAAALVSGAADLLLAVLARGAALLYPLVRDATDPAIPLSLLLGLGVAIYHELSVRREPVRVQAS